MRTSAKWWVSATVLFAVACGEPANPGDGGTTTPDAGSSASDAGSAVDAGGEADAGGRMDAGGADAGAADAGAIDAGPLDAGPDAGPVDAGLFDAGADAGVIDAGQLDAGADAGSLDAGALDAGADAGLVDAGATDAGAGDAGLDAGACGRSGPAQLLLNDAGTTTVLRGTIVTPTGAIQGEVLVTGDTITCVAPSCGPAARVVETNGIVLPGLIDTHNHTLFGIFDESDWTPTQAYTNHNQWTNEARYGALVDAKAYLNGEGSSPVDLGCELVKYTELRALLSGTTSVVGAPTPANKPCYGTLARTIDQSPNGLGADRVQTATLFPSGSAADAVCAGFANGTTDAYLIHLGEGVDQTARNEWATLNTVTTPDGCLLNSKTAIVNGNAFGDTEFTVMGMNQMSLVWSPRSNVFLYGAGTDRSKTANVPLARSRGVNVALAPDWSIGGSQNLLDELRYAKTVDATVWGNTLSSRTLADMVTSNAARVLGLGSTLGTIEVGKKADLIVIDGDRCAPYDALLAARPATVKLTMVGGVVLTGDANLKPLGPSTPGCEDLTVCSVNKFACVATAGGTATNKFGQTAADIESALSAALTAYDAQNLTPWDFAPLAPLVACTP